MTATENYEQNTWGSRASSNGDATLAYNGAHRLATPAGSIVYHYDLNGQLLLETTAQGLPLRSYIWQNQTPLAQIDLTPAGPRLIYLHTDHLNTPRAASNATGTVVWRWAGEAFGSTTPLEDPDGDALPTIINLRFPGQYFDAETGFFYNWNRYYDPRLGRYITSDPIGLDGGINTYTYAVNNPLKYIDPTGEYYSLLFSELWKEARPIIKSATAAANCIACIVTCEAKVLTGANIERFAQKQAEKEVEKAAESLAKEYAKRGLKFLGWVGAIVTGVEAVRCLVDCK